MPGCLSSLRSYASRPHRSHRTRASLPLQGLGNTRLVERLDDGDEQALRLAAHSFTTERLWLMRLRSEATDGVAIWPSLSARACAGIAASNASSINAFLGKLSEDDLSRKVHYRNGKGTEYATSIGDVLTHVLLHSAYHRGQAATALCAAGAEPPVTDFIAYVREGF